MFTGIIQTIGEIIRMQPEGDGIRFAVKPADDKFLASARIGESISINGACMTAELVTENEFEFTTIKESLSKTNLGLLQTGDKVNIETAMTMNSKLDGHIVQGHVDTTGTVEEIKPLENSYEFFISFPSKFRQNIIYVGSIAVNGVSLTIAEIVSEDNDKVTIKIAIIPHTYEVTTFGNLKAGDKVNIEFDMIGKYVQRIMDKK